MNKIINKAGKDVTEQIKEIVINLKGMEKCLIEIYGEEEGKKYIEQRRNELTFNTYEITSQYIDFNTGEIV